MSWSGTLILKWFSHIPMCWIQLSCRLTLFSLWINPQLKAPWSFLCLRVSLIGTNESLDFYKKVASKTKSKKAFKKSLYQVAPKFPRADGFVEGERAINRTILKNRGLVAHKPKINRNPRVKKREQYRKALIRRKGAVREVREGEGHKYGGEGTGIKSNISRSRKL